MSTSDTTIGRTPSDRLLKLIWQMALSSGGNTPIPTIKRVAAIKRLAASWTAEDLEETLDEP